MPVSIALLSDTHINQSLARLVCSELSAGLWPHRLLNHLQRKVRQPGGGAGGAGGAGEEVEAGGAEEIL